MRYFFKSLLLLAISLSAQGHNKIVLASHELPPLSYGDSQGHVLGSAIRPVLFALHKMAWDYEIQLLPWSRAQALTKHGHVDGFLAAAANRERDSYAVFSDPIAYQNLIWVLRKDNPKDPKSLHFKTQAKVASYLGSNMLQWLQQEHYQIVGSPPDPDFLFVMLENHRFDACLVNDNNYANALSKHLEYQGHFRTVSHARNPLGVYFSKKFLRKHPKFLGQFNYWIRRYRD